MKNVSVLLAAGLIAVLTGCSTVSVQPVGPNPTGAKSALSTGQLEVFSRPASRDDDQNMAGDGIPPWHQYTAYDIYDLSGNMIKRVINSRGHYGERPDVVALPAGRYMVKAQAKDYVWVNVPVEIEPGRTTRVHLDEKWVPANAGKGEVVRGPDGTPVGWQVQSK
jgi:hypothetical protein